MVDALVETAPDRCFAGIWLKNNHLPPKNRQTPALVIFGSAQEWGQDKADYRTLWNNVGGAYGGILNERKNHPDWPLTYLIDGTSGHFDCSERLTQFVAKYIGQIARARLPVDGGNVLRPVALDTGFLADLPVPGHENHPATAFKDTPADARALPWFFDRAAAEEAQSVEPDQLERRVATARLHRRARATCFPFLFNGITWMELNHLKTADRPAADDTGNGGRRHHLHREGHPARQAARQLQGRGRAARPDPRRADGGMDVRLRRTARRTTVSAWRWTGRGPRRSTWLSGSRATPPCARSSSRHRSDATPTPKARRKKSLSTIWPMSRPGRLPCRSRPRRIRACRSAISSWSVRRS